MHNGQIQEYTADWDKQVETQNILAEAIP